MNANQGPITGLSSFWVIVINFSGETLGCVGLISTLSSPHLTLLRLCFTSKKPTCSIPCQYHNLRFDRRHPWLPCGCDRLSGWCAGWPEGSWTAAGHWQALAGTAAEWPAPELHSCFSPDAEDSRVVTNPTKSMQDKLPTRCPPRLPPFSATRTRLGSTDRKEQNKEFQKLQSSHNTGKESPRSWLPEQCSLIRTLIIHPIVQNTLTMGPPKVGHKALSWRLLWITFANQDYAMNVL